MKCRDLRAGDPSRPALAHSSDCRTRIEQLMSEDPELTKRLDRHQQRQDKYFSRIIEAGDGANKRPHFGSQRMSSYSQGLLGAQIRELPFQMQHPRGGGDSEPRLQSHALRMFKRQVLSLFKLMFQMMPMLTCRFQRRAIQRRQECLPARARSGNTMDPLVMKLELLILQIQLRARLVHWNRACLCRVHGDIATASLVKDVIRADSRSANSSVLLAFWQRPHPRVCGEIGHWILTTPTPL